MKIKIGDAEYIVEKLPNGKWTLPEAYENGDTDCTCGALDIDGNRVGTSDDLARINKDDNGMFGVGNNNKAQQMKEQGLEYVGRYPAQTFVDDQTAVVLDGQGDVSKVLHKCKYEEAEHDLYIYQPKVSKAERNAGCKNNHPTLKPIDLNYKVLKLFKTPNEQTICFPFAGAGSEIIGGIKAGFNNWHGCEINEEYVAIANARIEHWKKRSGILTN